MNELITIEKNDGIALFVDDNLIEPLLAKIAREARALVPDVSTLQGRKDITAMSYKVSQSKVYLDTIGKDLVTQYKELPKKIDAHRKTIRDFLDNLRDEVRQPLTDLENAQAAEAEAARLAAEAELNARIEADKAEQAAAELERNHELALLMNFQYEAGKAERLKAAQDAQDQREKEIADKAQAQATSAANARIEAAERETKEAIARTERAVIAERERAADATAAQHAETTRRMKDKAHKAVINRAVLTAFMELGFTESQCVQIVTAIATNGIPHTKIDY